MFQWGERLRFWRPEIAAGGANRSRVGRAGGRAGGGSGGAQPSQGDADGAEPERRHALDRTHDRLEAATAGLLREHS